MTHGYKQIKVGELTHDSLKKAVKGGTLSIPASKMNGERVMLVHPLNHEKWLKAKKAGRGCRMPITHGEIQADLDHHENAGAGLSGGSLWSWIKKAAKSVYSFAKNNWNVIKPIVSAGADALATAIPESAPLRGLVKSTTGVGLKSGKLTKGSQAAKDKMARLRSMKKSGGSFKL